jgi:serine/threonine protein kinase
MATTRPPESSPSRTVLEDGLIRMDEYINSTDKSLFEWGEGFTTPDEGFPKHRIFTLYEEEKENCWPFTRGRWLGGTPRSTIYEVLPPKEPYTNGRYQRLLALKVVRCQAGEHERWIKEAMKEVKNMRDTEHCHIVSYVASFECWMIQMEEDEDTGLVEEYHYSTLLGIAMYPPAKIDLERYLRKISEELVGARESGGQLSTSCEDRVHHLYRIFGCIAQAVAYLEEEIPNRIKHKDIKPANILIDKFGQPILTDFGISKRYEEGQKSISDGWTKKTDKYACPHALSSKVRNFRTEVFSLGCVYLEMVTVILGEPLAELLTHRGAVGDNSNLEYGKTLDHNLSWIKKLNDKHKSNPELPILDNISAVLKILPIIEKMMTQDLKNRPKVSQLWPFFRPLYFDNVCHNCDKQYDDRMLNIAKSPPLPPSLPVEVLQVQIPEVAHVGNGTLHLPSVHESAARQHTSIRDSSRGEGSPEPSHRSLTIQSSESSSRRHTKRIVVLVARAAGRFASRRSLSKLP